MAFTSRVLHQLISVLLLCSLLYSNGALCKRAFEVQGSATAVAGTRPRQTQAEVTQNTLALATKIKFQWRTSSQLRFNFEPWFYGDALNRSPEEQTYFEPHELNLEWHHGPQKIRVGYVTETWEGTDYFNPMDLIHAKNLREPLNVQDRSSPGIFHSGQAGAVSWDLAYIPWQPPSLLPGTRSPWWPRNFKLPVLDSERELLLPSGAVAYSIFDQQILNQALSLPVAKRSNCQPNLKQKGAELFDYF